MKGFGKFLIWSASVGSTLAIIGLLVVIGVFHYFSKDLPDYSMLENYHPPGMTRIYASDGRLMGEYAKEKRIFKPLKDIPRQVRHAFLSAEDRNFYHHQGIDAMGIGRAVLSNLRRLGGAQKSLVGGSTITQQVVKNFLLTNEKTLTRKVKEAILAFRITSAYSKDRILELYLNQIYFGLGSYGVAAAAQRFFDKDLSELNTEEMALLAAMPKAPSYYNPHKHYKAARQRRNYVLNRMQEDGYINVAEAERAKATPIELRERDDIQTISTGYFAEEVRRDLLAKYGQDGVYEGGLYVKTTMNPKLQDMANRALRRALMDYDRRHGFRGPVEHVPLDEGVTWKDELAVVAKKAPVFDKQRLGMVLAVTASGANIGFKDESRGTIPFSAMKWAYRVYPTGRVGSKPSKPSDVLKRGDVVLVEPLSNTAKAATAKEKKTEEKPADKDDKEKTEGDKKKIISSGTYRLLQVPKVDGALVAMDPHTGKVLAMAGGYDPANHFNRATQAKRQPGSAFKPFVYLTALERGFTPASIISDSPIEISQGPGLPVWRPKNYGGKFMGPSTLRMGLEKSRNVMTVRLAKMLDIKRIVRVGKRFGIYDDMPENYSMVLGSMETTLMKLTSAYSMIANGGIRVEPTLIERVDNNNGYTVYRSDARQCRTCVVRRGKSSIPADRPPLPRDTRQRVLDPRVAYQMSYILQGVVQRGTAVRAKKLGFPLAGKTGTTNESRDAWFMGFSPDMVVGVYIGFDDPKPLGRKETGGGTALPAFMYFMEEAMRGKPKRDFHVPPGISFINVDRRSGTPPLPWAAPAGGLIKEAFVSGGSIYIPEGEEDGLSEVVPPYSYSNDDSYKGGGYVDGDGSTYGTSNGAGQRSYDYNSNDPAAYLPDDSGHWQSLGTGAIKRYRTPTPRRQNAPLRPTPAPVNPTVGGGTGGLY